MSYSYVNGPHAETKENLHINNLAWTRHLSSCSWWSDLSDDDWSYLALSRNYWTDIEVAVNENLLLNLQLTSLQLTKSPLLLTVIKCWQHQLSTTTNLSYAQLSFLHHLTGIWTVSALVITYTAILTRSTRTPLDMSRIAVSWNIYDLNKGFTIS